MLQKRAAVARAEFAEQTSVIEKSLEENIRALHRLTASIDTACDDMVPVVMEQQYLKNTLAERKEAEVAFSFGGLALTFVLSAGECVRLEGVPGRPEVVWVGAAKQASGKQSEWQNSHFVSRGMLVCFPRSFASHTPFDSFLLAFCNSSGRQHRCKQAGV